MTKVSNIAESLIGSIEDGSLREGEQLPSEEKLAAHYRVSVGTVQKALSRLASSGLVSREHGRGTFVGRPSIGPAELRFLRFRDPDGSILPSYVRVRSIRRIARKGPWSEFLGGQAFIKIERLINLGGRLDVFSEFWLREADFERLEDVSRQHLEQNLRIILSKELSLPTLRADQWIRCDQLPDKAAKVLGCRTGQIGMTLVLRGYTLRNRELYYQTIYSGPFSEQYLVVR
ncbi:HTH-type transcriptional repressor YvoA [Variibacter gotjawalensis]|uniref:HTH-type transcriptional repressor YvoA n=1 Tax=Variibacter gotjawalensis TaxID=1333996 RepID=A0A0S3Q0Z3_9BRAD|nr:GntR family transcriptional regulator [Variibacter gotjawalensis]NIK47675.1 DNA-binding GntR family transcriptional regulator [Variibacter gotjawalensis]RZS49573.1 GntR family transcriptional regulator [Variibacter gotjawalensis]BAT61835.1 HTH-type transcriptional repressor YvoA [Variibacter gotjawalensis]